ncbi:efflux RND transporter permease subunit [Fimbriiglobus ruber]|uniref:RND efflux system, inner membrane transporter CmeB n=1 Tax=Fimbriiglobus ruber TaxID=1908690 RepID=A0A225D5H2_9BACT|nr:efflux RND transporter permease subunit [Fimbriiglobus ruber]OWK34884.1 RND efflux system, inner membrane transporter CmeB [Fimbriiglobus ruber]
MRLAITAVLLLACALPAAAVDPSAHVIRVSATYPGADARTVDETVLVPLFKQISGVEGITRIESEARADGTGTVTLFFDPKTDLNIAQVVVQNRVNLALPVVPSPCRQFGMPVRKLSAGPPTYWFALTSEDATHDAQFLAGSVAPRLKFGLVRVPGVVDVRIAGVDEPFVRVELNMARLTAYSQTVGTVVDALRRQNTPIAAGGIIRGPALQHAVTASGRLTDINQFSSIILKANATGEILRLRDVARVEFRFVSGGFAILNGKPAALVAVTAWPGRLTADQFRKVEEYADLPPGIRFDVFADRTADHLLEVDVRVPGTALPEQTEKVVARAAELVRGLPGKPTVAAFAEERTPNAAKILVKVPAEGGPTVADVERALAAIPAAAFRVGSAPPGKEAFPVRVALTNLGFSDEESNREVADRVVARLKKEPGLVSPAAFPGPDLPHFAVNVDRDRCAIAGVELDDVFTTLQATLGGVYATDFYKFNQTYRVIVQGSPEFSREIDDLTDLRVRSATGDLVTFGKILKVRKALASPSVVRVNGYQAVVITAAPAAGKTPAEAAARCVKLAQEVVPRGYRVTDLTGLPR